MGHRSAIPSRPHLPLRASTRRRKGPRRSWAVSVALWTLVAGMLAGGGVAAAGTTPRAALATPRAALVGGTTPRTAARGHQLGSGPFPAPTWVDTVGPLALSSPTTGVLDGQPVVAFGSESGYLYVVNARTGANLPGWPQPVELAPGAPSAIESSPTFAYLDGPDRPPLIVVGAGSTYVANQQGGLVAFHPDGTVAFEFHTQDVFNEWKPTGKPGGYDNGIISTPAVGDVTGSGQLDLVFGSWDHELYALTAAGKLVPGFPVNNLDTIWSSPALVHLRGAAGTEDIIVGSDASGRGGCYGGFLTDYTYQHGGPHMVWQHCMNQTIWSSPAVGVIDATGQPAVVVGTGFGEPPPYKSDSYHLFAFYAATGQPVPGWPVTTSGPSFGSPAIGMLPGSTTPAVVDTSWCTACSSGPNGAGTSEVSAWASDGKLLWTQRLGGADDLSSPVLVDLTGTGVNDVLVGSGDGMVPLSGSDGSFMFGTSATNAINPCSMLNTAAVDDVPGTGPGSGWHVFEACGGPHQVTGTGTLYDYPLPATPATPPPWPSWRGGDANHDGVATWSLPAVPPPTTTTTTAPITTVPTTTAPAAGATSGATKKGAVGRHAR